MTKKLLLLSILISNLAFAHEEHSQVISLSIQNPGDALTGVEVVFTLPSGLSPRNLLENMQWSEEKRELGIGLGDFTKKEIKPLALTFEGLPGDYKISGTLYGTWQGTGKNFEGAIPPINFSLTEESEAPVNQISFLALILPIGALLLAVILRKAVFKS